MKKLDELQNKIDKLKVREKERPIKKSIPAVFDIATQFVASVLVGVIVGLMIDNLFNTKPIFLIVCMIFSIIAAFRLVWKKYIK